MAAVISFFQTTGIYKLIQGFANIGSLTFDTLGTSGIGNLIMVIIACFLLYLALVKQFEPLLLVTIAFGMLLSNLPCSTIFLNSESETGILYLFYT